MLAWPTAKYAVMGAAQASDTVFSILARSMERGDKKMSQEELEQLREKVKQTYEEQTDIRYGAARGWVDALCRFDPTRVERAAHDRHVRAETAVRRRLGGLDRLVAAVDALCSGGHFRRPLP